MNRERANLLGRLVEVDWDQQGRAIALGLETETDLFTLADADQSRELDRYVGRRIRASGWVTRTSGMAILGQQDQEDLGRGGARVPCALDVGGLSTPILTVEAYEVLVDEDLAGDGLDDCDEPDLDY